MHIIDSLKSELKQQQQQQHVVDMSMISRVKQSIELKPELWWKKVVAAILGW
jgi:hypothetical protein